MRQIALIIFLLTVLFLLQGQNLTGQSPNVVKNPVQGKQTRIKYTYKISPSINNTWGYDIFNEEKIFIHQSCKPGLPGNEGFKTKADAEKVARLIIKKIKMGEMPPSVTTEELMNMEVL